MRQFRLLAIVSGATVAFAAATVAFATPASAEELCDRFDTTNVNGGQYIVMNNVWGAETLQCIDVDTSTGAFQITQSQHNNPGGSVASYPTIYRGCHWGACTVNSGLPLQVDQIDTALSSWDISINGAPGTWNAAYDLWYHTNSNVDRGPDGAELMIWLDWAGGAGPAGSQVASNVPISGATWDVYFAAFKDWNYIAYLRTSPTSSVTDLDLNAFTQDSVARGHIAPSWYLSGVEAGFELWRQGAGLASNSFEFTTEGSDPDPDPDPDPTDEPPPPPGDCQVDWQADDWGSGFVANVTVTNLGSQVNGWELTWSFGGDQQVTNHWNAELEQAGQNVTAANTDWNGQLATGGTASFGFQAGYSGSNQPPTDFELNGASCTAG